MAAWNFDTDGTYVFNFSPSRDDFSQVKVGAAWALDAAHALPGNEFACRMASYAKIATINAAMAPDENWLYSAPFELRTGVTYEAGLKYKRIADEGIDSPRLTLRIGIGQKPSDQTQRLLEFSITNTDLDIVRTTFQVPADGVYNFSLEGTPVAGEVALVENAAAVEGRMPPNW